MEGFLSHSGLPRRRVATSPRRCQVCRGSVVRNTGRVPVGTRVRGGTPVVPSLQSGDTGRTSYLSVTARSGPETD